jgi:hypothetical protein
LAASPHLTRLTALSLGGNPISAAGAQALRQSASLRECQILGLD